MESILVLAHADETGSALTKASLEAVTAAKELAASLSASLTIGIVAVDPTSAGPTLASTQARLIAVSGEPFAQPRYATDAAACEALCRSDRHSRSGPHLRRSHTRLHSSSSHRRLRRALRPTPLRHRRSRLRSPVPM